MMSMEPLMLSDLPTTTRFKIIGKVNLILAFFLCLHIFADVPFIVTPDYETEPVISINDAADDPAIWFNPNNPQESLIFGTDKKSGIYVYDIFGNQISYTKLGKINNIDLRASDNKLHVVSSNRSASTLDYWILPTDNLFKYFKLNPNNAFSEDIEHAHLQAKMDIYGVCIGFVGNNLYAILTEEEGQNIQYWNLSNRTLEKTINLIEDEKNTSPFGNEAEGCVFDDENQFILISREGNKGYLKMYDSSSLDLIHVIDSRDHNIVGDPEGVAIYRTSEDDGYIILSSQGNSSFNIYRRKYPNQFVGSFIVVGASNIDGVQDTDGIAINNGNFKIFPKGMMVIQDGFNTDSNGILYNQNFKIVSFDKILENLDKD